MRDDTYEYAQITYPAMPTFTAYSKGMAEDAAFFRGLIDDWLDRRQRPWKYPDVNPMPLFDLFPHLTRRRRQLSEVRRRVAEAVGVLRYGVNDREDW